MSAIDDILAEARAGLERAEPSESLLNDPKTLIVDIRPAHNRAAEGEIPGSVVIERIVLEWRLDPAGDHRIDGFDADTRAVVVCNEGYSSSLAARDLRAVGLPRATDLVGGFRGWKAAGLPTRPGATTPIT
ncbi:rhodanese-like domain-containing protein [Kibdelosporangium phytohabitans]|uniref:Sulfurtransferase n=1 Tax=Kibdelosporangium phytohabitans TaxID=860235 RepID=A0A0N9IEM2_9PSEU|nr:rhodanese-like domain-containing protein [Kibdelosporangium phytohabitans]ALG13220.1 sulfurtransferase [Kibdelosporangium phytohabitans]MBE1464984.1 rhodanese-related sulfurtransferase [Kibdelosporangium phytohabitans]